MSSKFATGVECRTAEKLDQWEPVGPYKTHLVGKKEISTPGFFSLIVKFFLKTKGLQIHIGHIIKKIRHTVEQMKHIVLNIGQNIAQLNICPF